MNKYTPFSITISLLIALMMLSQSCLADESKSANEITLENKKWIVEQIGQNKSPHLGFIIFEDSRLNGQSTCNLYDAVYNLKPNQAINIYRVSVGILQCKTANKMKIESQYIAELETAARYNIKDGKLILYKADNTEIARFK